METVTQTWHRHNTRKLDSFTTGDYFEKARGRFEEMDRRRFASHVKNKLHLGDTIGIMPFQGEIINCC